MTTTKAFIESMDRKLARARRLTDKVDDVKASRALDAIVDLLDSMINDQVPEIMMVDPSEFLAGMEKGAAKSQKPVQTKKVESAGEKIAHSNGHFGQYL